MGRYLDHAGTKDNPLQGLSLDGELQPGARDRARAGRGRRGARATYDFWAPGVWGDVETRMLEALSRSARARFQHRS